MISRVAALLRAGLQDKAVLAKNDWGIIFWGLTGFILLLHDSQMKWRLLLAGTLMGLAVGGKISSAVSILVLLILARSLNQKLHLKAILWIGLGAFCAFLPSMIRSWLWTGNPVFPVFRDLIENQIMGPTWIRGLQPWTGISLMDNLTYLPMKLHKLVGYNWTNLLSLIPFGFIFHQQTAALARRLWLAVAAGFFILVLTSGRLIETRHLSVLIILVPWFTLYHLKLLLRRTPLTDRIQLALGGCVLAGMMVQSYRAPVYLNLIPENISSITQHSSLYAYMAENFQGIKLQRWSKADQKFYYLGDFQPYYWRNQRAFRLWDNRKLDQALYETHSSLELISVMIKNGGTHLVYEDFMFDTYYNPKMLAAIKKLMQLCPQAQVPTPAAERVYRLVDLLNCPGYNSHP